MYDFLARKELSMPVIIDCMDTLRLATALRINGVITSQELHTVRSLPNPNLKRLKRWLIFAVARKPLEKRKKFVNVLLETQPHLLTLSRKHWFGPERKCLFIRCKQGYGSVVFVL